MVRYLPQQKQNNQIILWAHTHSHQTHTHLKCYSLSASKPLVAGLSRGSGALGPKTIWSLHLLPSSKNKKHVQTTVLTPPGSSRG